MRKHLKYILLLLPLVLMTNVAYAQLVVQDNFTGASTSYDWKAFNGACLTAGNNTGNIPACVGLPYYKGQTLIGGVSGQLPDPVGQGALRFTNGYTQGAPSGDFDYGFNQTGGIISNFTFPSNEGLDVTFTAISYAGNSGGSGQDGADGISFFLINGNYPASDTGGLGGSLGYDCSNGNPVYDGIVGAYLGLGIDEYGNFLNPGDNTNSGPGFQPSRIGLRGAGNIAWSWLHQNYPDDYPSGLSASEQQAAVQETCQTGTLWDNSNMSPQYNGNTRNWVYRGKNTGTRVMDYPYIPNTATVLPNNNPIADESARKRGDATPITYKLKITTNGLLSFSYSYNGGVYQPVITDQSITASNGPLPSSFRFGFAGSTGGSTNVHEIMCFKAKPSAIANGSAGLNEKESSEVRTGTQVYFAFYDPSTWAGSLTATNLVFDSSTNTVAIAPLANWDASCVLTGVAAGSTCPATGGGTMSAESPASRTILTWNDKSDAGVPFELTDLSPHEKKVLSKSTDLIDYLRGDRSNEQTSSGGGTYRIRTSVLGDIVDSSPTWVGAPSAPYATDKLTWADRLYPGTPPEASGESYASFQAQNATRTNMVYVGSNDGLLHGFRAGAYDSSGNWNASAPNDGEELLAYMPQTVLDEINSSSKPLNFSSPNYGHAFYVDATPGSGDLYFAGSWHTWLIGGLGYGGKGLYALDVTDPASFSQANASSIVLGDWTPSTISCENDSGCGDDMGEIGGTPVIRRFHNGDWGAVFGNGLNSSNGRAGIYVMLVDSTTGNISFYFLAVPQNSQTKNDGIEYATPADLDGDHIVDYVYAGDVDGNVWRFDLTSNDPNNWTVDQTPVFSTPNQQPITTKVVVASIPSALGLPRVLVSFGTGQQMPFTNTSAASYAQGQQSIYGIWDWNMASWNSKGSQQMASLSTNQAVTVSDLEQQTVLSSVSTPAGGVGSGYRIVSNNSICWRGDAACGSSGQMGWVLNLPSSGEQVVYNPTLQAGAFIVNTLIPPVGSPTNCETLSPTGWTMALSIATGGAFNAPIFITPNHHYVIYNDAPVNGVQLNATGTPTEVTTSVANSSTPAGAYLVMQTVGSTGTLIGFNPAAAIEGRQVSWAEFR